MIRMIEKVLSKKHLLASLVFVPACIAVFASSASAQTDGQARTTAVKEQIHDCNWNNPVFYKCHNPLLIVPSCVNTGHNRYGQVQHICGGMYTRDGRRIAGVFLLLNKRYCETTYDLSPTGRVMNNLSTVQCYTVPPLLA